MPMEAFQRETTTDRVYAFLKQKITAKDIKPGDRLVAHQIARELQVSATPVRETLRLLERDGLIHNEPHKGAVVVKLDRKDILDLFEVRMNLEGIAVRHAAKHATEMHIQQMRQHIAVGRESLIEKRFYDYVKADGNFHRVIAEASDNNQLHQMLLILLDRVDAFINRTVHEGYTDKATLALYQHDVIVNAIADHNVQAAETACRDHLQMSLDYAMTQVAE